MTQNTNATPRWGSNTKLLVGLIVFSLFVFLLYRFSNLMVPLLMIFIISYLLHPVSSTISRLLHISWRASVNILFVSIVVILIGLLAWGGVGLFGQIQSLINAVQGITSDIPKYISELSTQVIVIGPITLDMKDYDLNDISTQVIEFIKPALSNTGNIVGALAGSAIQTLGWTIFVLTVLYFVMLESSGIREDLLKVDIPGYTEDICKLGNELSRIWNAFLRGQILIFLLALVVYSILLPAMGVRYALVIALMAGLAKFLPYVGPAITWVVMALVTFFQPVTPFGLQPLTYMLIVVVTTSIIDWSMDNLITPRIMAQTLRVHPAAVLVAAVIATNLLGLLGLLIAAPFLASFLLLGKYVMRKMFDLDPWPETDINPSPPSIGELIKKPVRNLQARFSKKDKPDKEK